MTALIALIATLGAVQDQPVPPAGQGREMQVCGIVARTFQSMPSKCDTILRVGKEGEQTDVVLPASLRPDLPLAPERMQGANVCFTGAATLQPTRRIQVSDPRQVRVVADPPTFGAGAALSCEADVTMPEILSERKPQYTSGTMRAGVQGTVVMDAVVDEKGLVREVRVASGLHPELDANAVQALTEWRFKPGTRNGTAAAVMVNVEMSFTVRSKR